MCIRLIIINGTAAALTAAWSLSGRRVQVNSSGLVDICLSFNGIAEVQVVSLAEALIVIKKLDLNNLRRKLMQRIQLARHKRMNRGLCGCISFTFCRR